MKQRISSTQRAFLIGSIAGYRTSSYSSTYLILGIIKLELSNKIKVIRNKGIDKKDRIFKYRIGKDIKQAVFTSSEISEHVGKLIPTVYDRLNMRKSLPINNWNTQAFSGNGKCAAYLYRFKKTNTVAYVEIVIWRRSPWSMPCANVKCMKIKGNFVIRYRRVLKI